MKKAAVETIEVMLFGSRLAHAHCCMNPVHLLGAGGWWVS